MVDLARDVQIAVQTRRLSRGFYMRHVVDVCGGCASFETVCVLGNEQVAECYLAIHAEPIEKNIAAISICPNALSLHPFAVDQHVMLLGQKRFRVLAKLRFGDGDVHDVLPRWS
jgi:hypothetical protein